MLLQKTDPVDRKEGDQAIRRAFERGFLELELPASHLEFRYRVWCEARRQPFVSLLPLGDKSVVEMDLSRGPCQLSEESLAELKAALGCPFQELTRTRCRVEVPSAEGVTVAIRFFETAWRLAQE